MDHTQQPPVVLSTCTGGRGLERGLERAIGKLRTIAYVEGEAFACENLVQQMEQGLLDPAPVWSNLKTFLPVARKLRGKVDIITGGYPCQPFSHVGQRRGVRDPRHLWPYYEDIIDTMRPLCCFFENVSNHLNIGYRQVRCSLERLGYTVEQGIFSAEEIGAPHIRKRLFIVALANNYRSWRLQPFRIIEEGQRRIDNGSDEMDNSDVGRYNHSIDEIQTRRISIVTSSKKLGDTDNHRLEEWRIQTSQQKLTTIERTSVSNRWPLGQGIAQYEWEEPRMLESSLGLSVNGYNYREDLLRMAGNAVVEQTAELAFRTLIQKFI